MVEVEEVHRAYLLHLRRYTDTRSILELFTASLGRMALVARTGGKRSANYLHFKPAQVFWRGQGELKTLISYESLPAVAGPLSGSASFCGLYINELIQRLLPIADPYPSLFKAYEDCLTQLSAARGGADLEVALRRFELIFLRDLGLGLDFEHCAESGKPLNSKGAYRLVHEFGFESSAEPPELRRGVFAGRILLAIAAEDFSTPDARRVAKAIARASFSRLLGGKPLKSREFFQ